MSVNVLLVEGNLDSEVLFAVFQGSPTVRRGGSKDSLKPQARYERERNLVTAGYVRDRDFDYEPPVDCSVATVDSTIDQSALGWRWARHEIENYLLDPRIVEKAIQVTSQDWSEILVEVAGRIRWYQIARWTVGQVRRKLPPHYELKTRPTGLNDLQLPTDTTERASRDWCLTSIREFAATAQESMSAENVESGMSDRSTLLSCECLSDVDSVLTWCSGKDLLAGIPVAWLSERGFGNAGEFRAALRDWLRANIDIAVAELPEWQDLIKQVRA